MKIEEAVSYLQHGGAKQGLGDQLGDLLAPYTEATFPVRTQNVSFLGHFLGILFHHPLFLFLLVNIVNIWWSAV